MAEIITDARIGVMKNGLVTQYPSRFINGAFWNRAANPTPTTHYFGKDLNYFCVLPIGVGGVPQEIKDEMLLAIGELPPKDVAPEAIEVGASPAMDLAEDTENTNVKPEVKKKSK